MKRVAALAGVKRIISEPGDGARYDYIVAQSHQDEFIFAPFKSTFAFPPRISKWDAKAVKNFEEPVDEVILAIAKKYQCNPWTVLECARTVAELCGVFS
jgi:hypothetical protein